MLCSLALAAGGIASRRASRMQTTIVPTVAIITTRPIVSTPPPPSPMHLFLWGQVWSSLIAVQLMTLRGIAALQLLHRESAVWYKIN